MKYTLIAFLFALLGPAYGASANEAVAQFDGRCIGTNADLSLIEKMTMAAGGKVVPSSVAMQDAAVARHGGKVFAIRVGKLQMAIAATPIGTCSIIFADESPEGIRQSIEANYPLAPPFIDSSGPQTTLLYRILEPAMGANGYIMIVLPKPGFDADRMFVLGYLTPAAAKKQGVRPR